MGRRISEWNLSELVVGRVGKQTASCRRGGMGRHRNVVIPNRTEALPEAVAVRLLVELCAQSPAEKQNVIKRL